MTPFWTTTTGPDLAQGDLLTNCLVPIVPNDFDPSTQPTDLPIRQGDLVVLTQSCDLVNLKAGLVSTKWFFNAVTVYVPLLGFTQDRVLCGPLVDFATPSAGGKSSQRAVALAAATRAGPAAALAAGDRPGSSACRIGPVSRNLLAAAVVDGGSRDGYTPQPLSHVWPAVSRSAGSIEAGMRDVPACFPSEESSRCLQPGMAGMKLTALCRCRHRYPP
jgi:hypothetical protein